VVEPVDPFQGGVLDLVDALPRSATNAPAWIPSKEGYRPRRGQVANQSGAEQPPCVEAGVGVSAPPTPTPASA